VNLWAVLASFGRLWRGSSPVVVEDMMPWFATSTRSGVSVCCSLSSSVDVAM
jgi:hypothetical protein